MSPTDRPRGAARRREAPPVPAARAASLRTAAISALAFGLAAAPAAGEWVVIGGHGPGSRPWSESGSVVSVIDFDTNPGFIQPSRHGPEDNIALGLLDRGGAITSPNARVVLETSQSDLDGLLARMVDGGSEAFEIPSPQTRGIIFRVDLGQRFGINRIRFYPRQGSEEQFLRGYRISLNDGSEAQTTLGGEPKMRLFKSEDRNTDPVVDIPVPLQFVRFIEVQQLVRGAWEIDEFEVFGEGFPSAASLLSAVFDQGAPAVFGTFLWAGDAVGEPAKVSATVRTRSGTTPDPGDSLAWSGWSPPYPAGVPTAFASPAPRRYWQFHVQLGSTEILSAALVDSIAVEVSPALADSLVAEVWPREALIGQTTELTYWVRSYNSRGFDRFDIDTQAPVEVVRSVQIDGSDVAWEKTEIDGGLRISFPRITGDRVLRVVFESIALQYNTVFTGRASDSGRPRDLPQAVVPGDAAADPAAEGDDLTVVTRFAGEIIHAVGVDPAPFSPNGDGVNDEAAITWDIANLTSAVPVSAAVYDLAGRRLRVVHSGLDGSGRFGRAWDGTDDAGRRLPPGLYVVRVEVDTDTGTESRTAIVPVVY